MTREEINDVNDDDINTMRILFNALINDLCNQCRHNDAEEMEGIRDRLIKRLLEQEPEWIPVSERLPEDGEVVLFSTKTDRVFNGRYFADDTDFQWYAFRDETFVEDNVITAWMPLPQPYKAESEDKE